jgi:glycosyltransferase involved in cell wall biosynthesis
MNLNSTLVSFVIPCFNEEETLPSLIDEIMNTVKEMSEFEFEFILVNDGSTDSTLEIMKSIQRQLKKIIILDIPEQSGKIKAQAIGIENISSNSDISILIDADGQHNPKYLKQMLELTFFEKKPTFTNRKNNQRTFLAKIGVLALSLLTKIAGVKYNSKISEFICVPNNALAKISKDARFGVIPIVMLIEDKISDCNYIEITIRPRYKNNEPSDKLSRHHPIDLYKKGFFHLFTNIYEILFRIFIFIGIIFSILAVYLFIIFIEAISNRNFNGVGSIILVQLISLFILTTIIVVMISMVLAFTLSFESLATKSRLTRDLKIYK